MKRFNIIQKSTGNILDHGNFQTEADGHIWFQPIIDRGVYGQKEIPERKELITVLVSPSELIKEAVLDETTGEELEPAIYSEAVYEDQEFIIQEFVPAEYSITITDITDEVALEKEKAEAQAFLDSTDWMVLKYLRHKALGRDPSMSEEDYLALELQQQEAADKL